MYEYMSIFVRAYGDCMQRLLATFVANFF